MGPPIFAKLINNKKSIRVDMIRKSFIMVAFLFVLASAIIFFIHDVNARTLYVGGTGDGNYTSIQQAVNNATGGDVIYVYSGVYNENIFIPKYVNSLKLIGENRDTTVINGVKENYATLEIWGKNCTFENFTVTSSERSTSIITISYTDHVKIINNRIEANNNTCIYMFFSTNVTILNNSITGGGINIVGGSLENWNTHIISGNTLNGRRLYYINDVSNFVISSEEVGQIILVNCTDSSIKNVDVSKSIIGLLMAFSSNNVIKKCHIHDNHYGIFLHESKDNIIEDNLVENNTYGIYVTHSSYNEIKNNLIRWNENCGCWLCCGSFYNTIYMNNFTMNEKNAHDAGIFNKWYHKEVGNYWDDYNGTDNDGDGIGDSPYIISAEENETVEDKYPIVSFEKVISSNNQTPGVDISVSLLIITLIAAIRILKKREQK